MSELGACDDPREAIMLSTQSGVSRAKNTTIDLADGSTDIENAASWPANSEHEALLEDAKQAAVRAFASEAELGGSCVLSFQFAYSPPARRAALSKAILPYLQELAASANLRVKNTTSGEGWNKSYSYLVVSLAKAPPTSKRVAETKAKEAIDAARSVMIDRRARRFEERLRAIIEHTERPETFTFNVPYDAFDSSSSDKMLATRLLQIVQEAASARKMEIVQSDIGRFFIDTSGPENTGEGHWKGNATIELSAMPAFKGTVARRDYGEPELHLVDGRIREHGETWVEGEKIFTCVNGKKERDSELERRYRTNWLARLVFGNFRSED
jgi:hypothetical protein